MRNEERVDTRMIRKFKIEDLDQVMELWFSINCSAHSFISKEYWEENFEMVKEMMPKAELYIEEQENRIHGFIGMMEEYIAGLFVSEEMQGTGIGTKLVEHVKQRKESLVLQVYQKNNRATSFYEQQQFVVEGEQVDEATGEAELLMKWTKGRR